MFCKVKHCRFNNKHVTAAHQCSRCKKFGHGRIECGNHRKIQRLHYLYRNDVLPDHLHCNLTSCRYPRTHTLESHHCGTCNKRGHSAFNCIRFSNAPTICPPANTTTLDIAANVPLPTSTNSNRTSSPNTSLPSCRDNYFQIRCPLCKKDNIISETQVSVKGNDATCCVCLDDKVQIFFPKCGHVCVCSKCFSRMSKPFLQKAPLTQDDIVSESDLPNCIREETLRQFGNTTGKIYTSVLSGMNCYYFVRRINRDANLEGIFMHCDSWGQYGSRADDTGKLDEFCDGYNQL